MLTHGTLGGRFTTLEGILEQVYEELAEKVFMSGDSSKVEDKVSFETFLQNLKQVGDFPVGTMSIVSDKPLQHRSRTLSAHLLSSWTTLLQILTFRISTHRTRTLI